MNALQIIAKPTAVRLPKAKRLTYEEYARRTPPDSSIYELHNGQIVKMPTPTPKHQRLSMRLSNRLFNFIEENRSGELFSAPMDTVFTPHDVLQPDILFLSANNLHLIGDKKIEGAPDLVVEILSPSNHAKEMAYKKMIYELAGVREYWLVNLENQTITQYENIEKEFVKRQVLQKTDILQAIVLQGFQIKVENLFE